MTTKRLKINFLLSLGLALQCLFTSLHAAEHVESFDEALAQAGADGVIAFCYGPDWNMRSARMYTNFWKISPELRAAAGEAKLVAVPFYQDPDDEQRAEASMKRGSMQAPPFGVFPTVLMFDKNGRLYATLVGTDYLGEEDGALAVKNVADRLDKLRRQIALLQKIELGDELETAALLTEVNELGISPPADIISRIEEADKTDDKRYTRRAKHDALQFMYTQLETSDGFLKDDFVEDVDDIKKAVFEIAKDEHIKPNDRQAAYNLYLGAMRRAHMSGSVIKSTARQSLKISETTYYGSIMETLADLWGKRARLSSDERKKIRDAKKQKLKSQKDKEKRGKKEGDQYDFD